MNKLIIIGIIFLTCSSCATLLNSRTKQLTIYTDTPVSVVMNKDTVKSVNNQTPINALRSGYPLQITVFNKTISKNIDIQPNNSVAYWANLTTTMGLGFLVDMDNPKRYAYPPQVYLSMKDKYENYHTLDSASIRNKFILKLSPLKLIDFSNTGLEFSCEHATGKSFSTQLMASWLFPANPLYFSNNLTQNIKGYRVALEEKYYFKKSAPIGPYVSFEVNYLKKKSINTTFHDSTDYHSVTYPSHKDSTGVSKKTLTLNFKIGYQYFIKRFTFDIYTGLGARFKDIQFDKYNHSEISSDRFFAFYEKEGKYWRMNIPLNVRIGWTF